MTFEELFVGSSLSHGRWDPSQGAQTLAGPARLEDYQAHLHGNGLPGLGLVPVREDGTCRFAALDIDDDRVDHAALLKKVQARNLPLHVCRSKSGGAHLYMFFREPGVKASQVQAALKTWSKLIGFPTSEVFPKQAAISSTNLGSWINLPYYANERTTRYCYGPNGAWTLEEFLANVRFYEDRGLIDEAPDPNDQESPQGFPPCLNHLTQNGLQEGSRNLILFNLGVYFRKSNPDGWEDQLKDYNRDNGRPPLKGAELRTIIQSVGRIRYQYTCNQEPLTSCCNRAGCLRNPYGVGNTPWQARDEDYDHLELSNLRKVLTDPPRYILSVNGRDTELIWDDLFDYTKLKRRLNQVFDLVLPPRKADSWDAELKRLLKSKVDVPAPANASGRGLLQERLLEFLSLAERGNSVQRLEDLLKGLPVIQAEKVLFRISDFQKYLSGFRTQVETPAIFQLVAGMGGDHQEMVIKGRRTSVWRIPIGRMNRQTEDFDKLSVDVSQKGLM